MIHLVKHQNEMDHISLIWKRQLYQYFIKQNPAQRPGLLNVLQHIRHNALALPNQLHAILADVENRGRHVVTRAAIDD